MGAPRKRQEMKSRETEGTVTKEGDEERREMKLKSDDIEGRRHIFYDDFEPL